jgi:type I restriction enzyme S subunit
MKAARQKEARIGSIGDHWKLAELHQVAEPPQYGLTASAAKTGNTQFLRITDIEGRNVNWTSVPYCDCPTDDLPKYRLASGDILFARIGATTGKSTLVVDPPNAVFASYLIRVRAKPGLDSEFLSHFFQSQAYWLQIDGSKHTNLKKGVNGSLLKALLVPTPPLDEQRQIAQVLSAAQKAIERQERLIALTAELKKALMHRLFTRGTRGELLKQTEIGPVPESWDTVALGSLGKIGNGSTPKRDNTVYWDRGTIPWLTSGKIHESRIKKADQYVTTTAKADCHLPLVTAGSLLIAITGEGKTLGNVAIVEFDTCISQHLAYVQFHGADVVPAFLLYFLQHQYNDLRQMSVGAGSTKKALTCGILKRYMVPVPRKSEQDRIAKTLDAVVAKMEVHQRTAESLRSLFYSLLQQLMTARVRVHDLDLSALDELAAEPAEVT